MHHHIPHQYHREAWKIATISALTIVLGTFAVVVRHINRYPSSPLPPPEPSQTRLESSQTRLEQNLLEQQPATSAHSAILYRTLSDSQWAIHAVNTDGTADTVIAVLPGTTTQVHWIDESHVLYTADSRIMLLDITDQTERIVIQASLGYQISESIISADHRWIAYRQTDNTSSVNDFRGVFVAKLDTFPAVPKSVLPDLPGQNNASVPLFFDHRGRLYVSTESDGTFSQITISENPPLGAIASLTDEASAKAVATAPLVKRFKGKTVCTSAPVISPLHDVIACIGPQPSQTWPQPTQPQNSTIAVSGIYLMDLSSGLETFLLPPSGAIVESDSTTATTYTYISVLWYDDGRRLAAQAVPAPDTTYNRRVTVTINPEEEQLTILDSSSVTSAMDLFGYTADGVVLGIPSGDAVDAFFIHDGDTTTTIDSTAAYFIATLPGIVPLQ